MNSSRHSGAFAATSVCPYLCKLTQLAAHQEDHLEQIKLARSKASNLLVPDDYDGSTYHAKLSRELAEVRYTSCGRSSLTPRVPLSLSLTQNVLLFL